MANQGHFMDVHGAPGATFCNVGGRRVPEHFGDPGAEYRALREAAGLIDLSHLGKVRFAGGEARDFLNRMLSNDVKGLARGHARRAFLLDPKGHVVAYLLLHALEDGFVAEAEPGMAAAAAQMLDRYIIADDVTVEDVSEAWALFSVQGPAAPAVLAAWLGGAAPDLEPLQHAAADVAGTPVRVVAHRRAGEPGFDVWAPAERAAALWEAGIRAGTGHGLRPVGLRALNVVRLEAGEAWGADVGGEILAMETGLEQSAISFSKGCYIGQEFVIRVAHRGHVNRRLSGLVLQGGPAPEAGARLTAGGKDVGWITSAALSPALGRPIALGYVRREQMEPGSKVAVDAGGALVDAEVVALPFVPPRP